MILDAHLDLSMNALEWNRDLTLSLEAIREGEAGLTDKLDRGLGVVCLPEMRRGGIGLCIATQIARYSGPDNPLPGWSSPAIAWAETQAQLAWYREMQRQGEMFAVTNRRELRQIATSWSRWLAGPGEEPPPAIGFVLSLEGADSLVTLDHLDVAHAYGLRAIGPAHYGAGRYAPGTGLDGPLTAEGRALLRRMDELGMALDATHLTDEGFWEALELFSGVVWASHSNCRALVPDQRQFSDDQLRALIERGAVIGAACDAWMLKPGWVRGRTTPEETQCTLQDVADQIDHVCQLAGNARHSGVGSDLDGGFGREQCPLDVDSIARLADLRDILGDRGYPSEDIEAIMHGNWVRRLEEALPE